MKTSKLMLNLEIIYVCSDIVQNTLINMWAECRIFRRVRKIAKRNY